MKIYSSFRLLTPKHVHLLPAPTHTHAYTLRTHRFFFGGISSANTCTSLTYTKSTHTYILLMNL